MGAGALVSGILVLRRKRMRISKGHIEHVMGYLWGGWMVCFLILMLFANLRQEYDTILPLTLAMYGLGIFISGGVVDFRPLIVGGIISWIGAVVAFFQPYTLQLLIVSGVIIVSYIIPGHILRRLSIKELA
jgi:multisubunit Na+/H+ antiporter MnhB subunit